MQSVKRFLAVVIAAAGLAATADAVEVTSAASGLWSETGTWQGGALPGPGDVVIIRSVDTVTIDIAATCAGLTVNGVFQFSKTALADLTINGNLAVTAGATFKAQTATTTFTGPHTLTITGDITNDGVVFDCRTGSAGSTLGVVNVTFAGSTNSTVTMNAPFSSTNGEFNGVTINKTGGAKVILASNMYMAGGSSSGPQTMTSILNFVSGIIETGPHTFVFQGTTAANLVGASSASYVIGAIGRGMGNSGGSSKEFPVGDASGYRPLSLRSTSAGVSTGHYAVVRAVAGNANTGTSTLAGGIDRVSAIRYYRITYTQGAGAPQMSFDRFYPAYGTGDGVAAGNTDLRAAYSTDERATWTGFVQSRNDTTVLTEPPSFWRPDSLNPPVPLQSGTGVMYVALARLSGTTTNDLGGPTAVVEEAGIPESPFVSASYPNPFNPSTTIEYGLPHAARVIVTVHTLLGQTVATLVDGRQQAGVHRLRFDGTGLPSGIYFCRVQADGYTGLTRMVLAK